MQYTYLMFDGSYYKIGKSEDPKARLKAIKNTNPKASLIAFSDKVQEKELHLKYHKQRESGEWFSLSEQDVKDILDLFQGKESILLELNQEDPSILITDSETAIFIDVVEKWAYKHRFNQERYNSNKIGQLIKETVKNFWDVNKTIYLKSKPKDEYFLNNYNSPDIIKPKFQFKVGERRITHKGNVVIYKGTIPKGLKNNSRELVIFEVDSKNMEATVDVEVYLGWTKESPKQTKEKQEELNDFII